jgi:hypothetical protein
LLDWQVPQAPVPALPQGPQELPQQNHEDSPAQKLVDPQAIVHPFVGRGQRAATAGTRTGASRANCSAAAPNAVDGRIRASAVSAALSFPLLNGWLNITGLSHVCVDFCFRARHIARSRW